nr:multicopper oxidase domain-containing protein [Ruegeria lacuscaerulensis]
MLWFHPHIYPATAELVIKGLAGLFIVSDEESDGLGLPSRWGVDDIPLIIQDRRFKPDGSFFHRFNLAAVTVGYVGDTALVNGSTYPIAKTAQGWLRLRILNGSNGRSYRLAASDNRSIHVIGSDGGLLEHPVSMKELLVHAGERFEVLVDARDGQSFDLVTLPVDQPIMRLPPFDTSLPLITIDPTGAEGAGLLPDALVTLPSIPTTPPPLSQSLTRNMNRDDEGMGALMKAGLKKLKDGSADASVAKKLTEVIVDGPTLSQAERSTANGVNGSSFALDSKPFSVKQNTLLRWRIDENSDAMLHPVHIHGCQFRVLSMDDNPPSAHLAGWKDTVAISKGGVAEILVNFPHAAEVRTPYMTHCHILEHEDSGMMAQFTVS